MLNYNRTVGLCNCESRKKKKGTDALGTCLRFICIKQMEGKRGETVKESAQMGPY